ncbi:Clp protease N-terminal domain-containing protein [Pseudonocardia humida]|uniref:ClpA/ClpB-like protein n=1 Tax=Pseudonocardia humida TaxID=2800819 RepID=A0ABT1A2C6_9PSEU|nr:hypothetical protein [Pseudonocardia humida]MCO1657142.1 hypothetical protein [Pseudonocardia humida]
MAGRTRRAGLGRIVLDASAVARSRGDRRVGTDHLVVAVLTGADPIASHALGTDPDTAYEALCELDRQALAAVGVTGVEVAPVPPGAGRRLPLTPGALSVFTGLGTLSRGERTGPKHVVLALLARRPPDPAAALLDALRVDRARARHHLGVA